MQDPTRSSRWSRTSARTRTGSTSSPGPSRGARRRATTARPGRSTSAARSVRCVARSVCGWCAPSRPCRPSCPCSSAASSTAGPTAPGSCAPRVRRLGDGGRTGSELTMELHYGGSLWMPMLDRLLADEIERSRARLLEPCSGSGVVIRAGAPVRVWPGRPYPLGATWDGAGTNFAVFSEAAEVGRAVPVRRGRRPRSASRCPSASARCGTATCPTSARAPRYGFRAHGDRRGAGRPPAPPPSCCSTPTPGRSPGSVRWHDAVAARQRSTDSAPYVPRSRGGEPVVRLGLDRRPATPWHETVLYEAHVQGPHHAAPRRAADSTAAPTSGLCAPPVIDHLRAPRGDRGRADAGRTSSCTTGASSSWGCATTGATTRSGSSPRTPSYTVGGHRRRAGAEFKVMVKTLHEAGIEVILDVVYNHTAEGGGGGPGAELQGPRQRRRTTGSTPRTRRATSTTRAPATA